MTKELLDRIDGLAIDLHMLGNAHRLNARMDMDADTSMEYHFADLFGNAAQALWDIVNEFENNY